MKKKKRETRGFVNHKRETKLFRDPVERQEDWEEIFDFKSVRRGLKTQAARCMDCGVPFCHSTSHGCPLGNIIPKFNDLVFHSDWREINEPPVTIKNIECSIIDNAFDQGWIKPYPPKFRTGKKVAIVGSGPSGLAAADQLNKVSVVIIL